MRTPLILLLLLLLPLTLSSLFYRTYEARERENFAKQIINIFDYPKLYLNKLYYCQDKYAKEHTWKLDLYDQEITQIVYYPDNPKRNSINTFDMLNLSEGKNEARFRIDDKPTQDETKFGKWTLYKTSLKADYSVYLMGSERWEPDWGDFECYQDLPFLLRKFK